MSGDGLFCERRPTWDRVVAVVEYVVAVVEYATSFGFSGRSNDGFEDGAVCVKCAIVGRRQVGSELLTVRVGGTVAEKEVTRVGCKLWVQRGRRRLSGKIESYQRHGIKWWHLGG